jgi:tRNA modification GTPase
MNRPTIGIENSGTIAAISTPMGEGGIGIVRLSGPTAISIAGKLFSSAAAGPTEKLATHTIHYGVITDPDSGEHIDEALLTLMRSPRTYTREDVVEINCHGGVLPLKKALMLCLKYGARLAEPGEFTRRAFLNGRIDLSQAEAVIDIIRAKTDVALKVSMKQLEGELAHRISQLRAAILNILAEVEAAIDFPEEELEILEYSKYTRIISEIDKEIEGLIQSCQEGKLLREGITTVLVGKPNVGKSSLLNALLDEERAIVTAIPGTTRDPIEEYLNIGGFPVRLVDTAGLTTTECVVEKEGVRRSGIKIEEADLVLAIFDGSISPTPEDNDVIQRLNSKKRVIVIINKSDLVQKFPLEFFKGKLSDKSILCLSATKREGIEELKKAVVQQFSQNDVPLTDRLVVTNIRHNEALIRTKKCLQQLTCSLENGYSAEFLAIDLKECLDYLGDILGETTAEDILDQIFSRFCIGK